MGTQLRSDSGQVFQARFAATGATVSKGIHVFNGRCWIALNTADAGASNEHVYKSEVSGTAKLAGEAWTPGQLLYWDAANARITTTASTNTKCGYAMEAALSAATVAPIYLFNTFAA